MHNAVAAIRKERGWSQQKIADELGVSRQTIISIEKGHFDPSLRLAFQLAALFRCTIEDLFTPDPEQTCLASQLDSTG